jgi:hemerythrin
MAIIRLPQLNLLLNKEHKDIIEFLIELENNNRSIKSVARILNRYLDEHMSHEEDYMLNIGYPEKLFTEHKSEHSQMRLFFQDKIDSNDKIELVRSCFVIHINKFDNLLSEWVKRQ